MLENTDTNPPGRRLNLSPLILPLTGLALLGWALAAPGLRLAPATLAALQGDQQPVASMREEFQRARRYEEPLSLLMVDIDGFKKYNDQHGHLRGDRVLAEMAELVLTSLRRDVDIVARYGGEEFACILPETNAPAAYEAADRIRRRVEAWGVGRERGAEEVPLTISVGVSTYAADWPGTPEELIERADQALYSAKRAGRNRVGVAQPGAPS